MRLLAVAVIVSPTFTAVVFVGYARRTHEDISTWNRAGNIQRRELGQLDDSGRVAPGTTIYAFGGIGRTAPGVFAFRVTWDLNGAVELLSNDATVHAYPIFAGTQMSCTATHVTPIGPANGGGAAQSATYPQAVFYDFRSARHRRIASFEACKRELKSFVPGPLEG